MALYLPTSASYLTTSSLVGASSSSGTIAWKMRPHWRSLDSTDRVAWGLELGGGSSSLTFERYSDNNLYIGAVQSGDHRITAPDAAGYFQPPRMKAYAYTYDLSAPLQCFYVEGNLAASRGDSWAPGFIPVTLTLGQFRPSAGPDFNADLEDFCLWSVPLTPGELAAYAAGVPADAIRPAARVARFLLSGAGLAQEFDVWKGNRLTRTNCLPANGTPPRRRAQIEADAVSGGGTVTGDASAAGVGTATGVGAATAAGVAAAAGAGVATGVGAFTLAPSTGVANAAGAGTATAVGAATAAAIATASGTGQALATGAAIGIISAVGNAAGTSEALGVSPQLLGGGEAGRGAKGGRARRKRIAWLPADYDIETGEPRVPIAAETAPSQPPSVKLTKGERKVARLLAQYRGRDDDTAERARTQLEALYQAQNSELARFIARQEQLDVQRRAAAAIAAEDDEAVVAFMQWLLRQP